ncbi:hypothetical protein LguiB_033341 [Lonicera macranthoides]
MRSYQIDFGNGLGHGQCFLFHHPGEFRLSGQRDFELADAVFASHLVSKGHITSFSKP